MLLKNKVYTCCSSPWFWGHHWGAASNSGSPNHKTSSLNLSRGTTERRVNQSSTTLIALHHCCDALTLLFTSPLMDRHVLVWHVVQLHVDRISFMFQARCRQRKKALMEIASQMWTRPERGIMSLFSAQTSESTACQPITQSNIMLDNVW